MVPVGEIREFSRNAVIFRERERPDFMFRLETGLVKIVRFVDKTASLVRVVRPGEYFDERALFDRRARRLKAIALCDCTVTALPLAEIQAKCEIWRVILEHAVQRAEEAEERAGRLAKYKVEVRLAHFLGDFVKACCPQEGVPLSQQELADMVGSTRESTCTALKSLEARGLVQTGRARVIVHKPEKLLRL